MIKVILEEEEELIGEHRQHIDDVVDIIKSDMGILQNVEEPQSDIEEYVDKLDNILQRKMQHILSLRSKLSTFYKHLKQEENLQRLYTTKLNESGQSHQIVQQSMLEQQQLEADEGSYANPNDYYSHYSQQQQAYPDHISQANPQQNLLQQSPALSQHQLQ